LSAESVRTDHHPPLSLAPRSRERQFVAPGFPATVDQPVEGHPAFSDAAIAAVRQWRFEPARLDGRPVAITVVVPVRFALD
jgi:hypothetical protein